ncbi:hypothetical protein [Streptomyces griseoaurantiacus]|uniref:hypothetical protein n=1 Tax=Streptomyces griseoaurantiacus TaxID=68213 RepID=UPI00368BECFB
MNLRPAHAGTVSRQLATTPTHWRASDGSDGFTVRATSPSALHPQGLTTVFFTARNAPTALRRTEHEQEINALSATLRTLGYTVEEHRPKPTAPLSLRVWTSKPPTARQRMNAAHRAESAELAKTTPDHTTADAHRDEWLAAAAEIHTRPDTQEQPMPTTPDTVTLRIPGTVAEFLTNANPDRAHALTAIDRDIAAALAGASIRRQGAHGTVHVITASRTLAAALLATLEAAANVEFDADHTNTRAARAALAYIARCATQGLTPAPAPADYRMTDPTAHERLDADLRARQEQQEQQERADADNAVHAAAWKQLTRTERDARTQEILDAAVTVFGFQRTDRAPWLNLGSLTARVTDGRLYMEITRLSDPTARPGLTAAQEALTAAGWTVTSHDGHFYAQQPQEGPEGPAQTPQGPNPTVVTVEWTKTVRGHHNGTATINGTAYRITHITHADPKRGALGDHLAHAPSTNGSMGPYVARSWGLPNLLATLAHREGITGPVTIHETGRERLTRH